MDGRIPLRVTGILRTAAGPLHVREAAADLLRFQTVVTGVEPDSTLIIERQGRPEGVAVGLGELRRLSSGAVYPLRGARPALRLVAGTGMLLLAFDSDADRDRAAAELLGESPAAANTTAIESAGGLIHGSLGAGRDRATTRGPRGAV